MAHNKNSEIFIPPSKQPTEEKLAEQNRIAEIEDRIAENKGKRILEGKE